LIVVVRTGGVIDEIVLEGGGEHGQRSDDRKVGDGMRLEEGSR